MRKDFEKTYHFLENRHFWFRARRSFIASILKHHSRDSSILDIGCSSGALLHALLGQGFRSSRLYGIDLSEEAIASCRATGLANTFVMDAQKIEMTETFDILIASDCLEHLKYDHEALTNWIDLLNPGGTLVVFVPAFNFLWSHHDEVNMHFRRYTRKGLLSLINQTGLNPIKSNYWNILLFIPVMIYRLLGHTGIFKKVSYKGDLVNLPVGNSFFYNLLQLENKVLQKFPFPFGISTYCVASKKL
jgi:trans-aconitate methyltransferase